MDRSSDNCVSVFIALPHSPSESGDQSLCSEISIPESFVLFRNIPAIVHEVVTQNRESFEFPNATIHVGLSEGRTV